jgi:hypothetical protein
MASKQKQCRKGDAAQEKVTNRDPPRSGLVLLPESATTVRRLRIIVLNNYRFSKHPEFDDSQE